MEEPGETERMVVTPGELNLSLAREIGPDATFAGKSTPSTRKNSPDSLEKGPGGPEPPRVLSQKVSRGDCWSIALGST